MLDPFHAQADAPVAPSRAPYAIVPDDTAPLPLVPKGIFVGQVGDVTLRGVDADNDVTYRNLPGALATSPCARPMFARRAPPPRRW